jgi:hypothetical protein
MSFLAIVLLLLNQSTPLTNLSISGAESATFSTSDANACYVDDRHALNAQLTDPSSPMIVSFTVLGTVGDHPALNQLTALTLDGPADDSFVDWSASGGSVSLDDIAASVPVEGGDPGIQASTAGVLGHIDADLTSKQGAFHISGTFACHRPD